MALAAQEGHVIPYFPANLSGYDAKLIEPLLEPGVPRINKQQMELIKRIGMCRFVEYDCKKCESLNKEVRKDFRNVEDASCYACLTLLYQYGYKAKKSAFEKVIPEACLSTRVIISRNLDAVFQTDCPVCKNSLSMMSGLPESQAIEYVCKGLKISYTSEIPLQSYLELLNGKATKAIRKTVYNILRDPYAEKYTHYLNAKIFEFNQQIQNLGQSRAAKFYKAISDLTIYGGSKFVEEQTRKYIKLPEKGIKNLAEWIASKALDLHARVTKKDWTIAQLYRLKCKLEKCREKGTGLNS